VAATGFAGSLTLGVRKLVSGCNAIISCTTVGLATADKGTA
jgi:hypothetical protein